MDFSLIFSSLLNLYPLSNVPLPEGQAGTAWEPSKQEKVSVHPALYVVPHNPPPNIHTDTD
jgi:hypothetical protein